MKIILYISSLAIGGLVYAAKLDTKVDTPVADLKSSGSEYFGLVDWSQIHNRKHSLDQKRILLDGFISVQLNGNLVHSVKIFETKEALEYDRDLMFINMDIDSFVDLAKKGGLVEPADLEGMDGSFIRINGRFSSEVSVDNVLGVLTDFEMISVGGGGGGNITRDP